MLHTYTNKAGKYIVIFFFFNHKFCINFFTSCNTLLSGLLRGRSTICAFFFFHHIFIFFVVIR